QVELLGETPKQLGASVILQPPGGGVNNISQEANGFITNSSLRMNARRSVAHGHADFSARSPKLACKGGRSPELTVPVQCARARLRCGNRFAGLPTLL